ncbi:hypothetical protein CEXT_534631 [Caerostris extrusa]|uniref:Uncharacterized protein n=1 Tax=Caerostris extrusa TaxID=172846 RepID=A0AAV4NYK5_CAEEX|nr:hypothetical protein CEXT_534631 [Caerostris extrusa]
MCDKSVVEKFGIAHNITSRTCRAFQMAGTLWQFTRTAEDHHYIILQVAGSGRNNKAHTTDWASNRQYYKTSSSFVSLTPAHRRCRFLWYPEYKSGIECSLRMRADLV